MAAISQLLRFTLPESPAKTSAFQTLRTLVTERGPVKTQYFGYLIPTESWTGPKEDQVCWYIGMPPLYLLSLFMVKNFSVDSTDNCRMA
jgi:hypothetical protein